METSMDIAAHLHNFESRLSTYTGDDPLDPWTRFVEYLEKRLPANDAKGMSMVFDRLVEKFLHDTRYSNDIRYVDCCIKYASFYAEPIALYGHFHGKGVGTRTAALYVAWARQFEQRGMLEQADAVFQTAVENQAMPADALLQEYRQFQLRTPRDRTGPLAGRRTPLQDSQLVNCLSHRDTAPHSKGLMEALSKPPVDATVRIISRSDNCGVSSSGQSSEGPQPVSAYCKEQLEAPGSELSFEELRANRYFLRVRQEEERRELEARQKARREEQDQEHVLRMEEELNQTCGLSTAAPYRPQGPGATDNLPPAGCRVQLHAHMLSSSTLSLQTSLCPLSGFPRPLTSDPQRALGPDEDYHQPLNAMEQEDGHPDDRLDVSQGPTSNLSHITPNTSLGLGHATPSRVLPSPTVNTREALDVIMDMFQAPTLLEDPFSRTQDTETSCHGAVGCSYTKTSSTTPFTIFQDQGDENRRPPAGQKDKRTKALAEVLMCKPDRPNETDLAPDESTTWGGRYNPLSSLAPCPNSTRDFAMSAQMVSTPFTHKAFFCDPRLEGSGPEGFADEEENGFVRQPKKLSPIIEQSPSEERDTTLAAARVLGPGDQGTILGEGVASGPGEQTSTLLLQGPPTTLSFRERTPAPARPAWQVYRSPEGGAPPQQQHQPEPDLPVSPQRPPRPGWLQPKPDTANTDLDALESPEGVPRHGDTPPHLPADVPMSPGSPPSSADVPMSPARPLQYRGDQEEVPMTPGAPPLPDDVPMSPAGGLQDQEQEALVSPPRPPLVPDPWDQAVLCSLLAGLTPPLDTHPHYICSPRSLPAITPRATVTIGKALLHVDCVLGQGAFATVYRASDPRSSKRVVLKVQKPANPWEFYINTQLDARLSTAVRHLYSNIRTAHLFTNGSVLLAELHSCGTLLNAVNLYKNQRNNVLPQPLVMFFTACILRMVEQLHAVGIVHADIKPDNFLLGASFLEMQDVNLEALDPGLALVDLGQSIDMQLFPPGTAFTARCLTSGFQCPEMLSGRPWSYQTDYFGIAATAYCMLFGTYMQVKQEAGVWKANAEFRRNPHSGLWLDFFHTLLNVPNCSSLPSLRGLRDRLCCVLRQNYANNLTNLKNRLVVVLLENKLATRR